MKKIKSGDARKGFVFYFDYYKAIQRLSKKNKLIAFEAIVQYELYQELDLEALPTPVYTMMVTIIPTIDKMRKDYNKKIAKKSASNLEEDFDKKVALPPKKNLLIANNDETTESEYFED